MVSNSILYDTGSSALSTYLVIYFGLVPPTGVAAPLDDPTDHFQVSWSGLEDALWQSDVSIDLSVRCTGHLKEIR